jgi:hypothetical protein
MTNSQLPHVTIRWRNLLCLLLVLLISCSKKETPSEQLASEDTIFSATVPADTIDRSALHRIKAPNFIHNDVLEKALEIDGDSLAKIVYEDEEMQEVLSVTPSFETLTSYDGNCVEALIVTSRHRTTEDVEQIRYSILTLDGGFWITTSEDFDLNTEGQMNTSVTRIDTIELIANCQLFAVRERYRQRDTGVEIWSWTSLYVFTDLNNKVNQFKRVLLFPDGYVLERNEDSEDTENPQTENSEEKITSEHFTIGDDVERLDLQKLEILSTYTNDLPDLRMTSTRSDTNEVTVEIYTFDRKDLEYKKAK